MGFGLVMCWDRGALHCCITRWWRFLEVNGHYLITSSRAFAMLILVPCNFDDDFWLHLSHLWMRGSDVPAVPSFCSGASGNTFPGCGASVRKRKDAKHLCTQWWYGTACFLYNTYPVNPEHWKSALLSVENCRFVFWLFFPPGFHGPSPVQPSVNL